MNRKVSMIVFQTCILFLAILMLTSSAAATSQPDDNVLAYELAPWLVSDQALQASLTQSAKPAQVFHYPVTYKQNPVASDRTVFVTNPQPIIDSTDFCYEN